MIVIHPYSKALRNGKPNAKNYPWWPELIAGLQLLDPNIVQVGVRGEQPLVPKVLYNVPYGEMIKILDMCHFWIGVDSFLQHLAHRCNKRGVVLWGPSNPTHFGYPENINIIKDPRYFRRAQFEWWEDVPWNPDAFASVDVVLDHIFTNFYKKLDTQ